MGVSLALWYEDMLFDALNALSWMNALTLIPSDNQVGPEESTPAIACLYWTQSPGVRWAQASIDFLYSLMIAIVKRFEHTHSSSPGKNSSSRDFLENGANVRFIGGDIHNPQHRRILR